MARQGEPFAPEVYYHLYSHAVGQENLFRTAENYHFFLMRYAAYAPPVVETFAYCLMPNHFHFLIQVRPADALLSFFSKPTDPSRAASSRPVDLSRAVAQQLGNWLNAYAKAYNRRYDRRGRLFVEGVRRKRVANEHYLFKLVQYIHWNPVHHGFVDDPADWPYSSFSTLMDAPAAFLNQVRVLQWFGGPAPYEAAHQRADDARLFDRLEDF